MSVAEKMSDGVKSASPFFISQVTANHGGSYPVKRPGWTYSGPIMEVLSVEPSESE